MDYFTAKGSKSDIAFAFSNLGIDATTANLLIDYLGKNTGLLSDDECVSVSTTFPSFPPGVIGLMVPSTNYYINIKITTIVVAAFLADISFGQGVLSLLLGLCGFSGTAFTRLNEELGEKCIVRETLTRDPKIGSAHILDSLQGECCNNDLLCKFRHDGKCHCSKEDILNIYERLADRNMFKRIGDYYKYQW